MKIKTTIISEVTLDDGGMARLERSVVSKHGDNPSFQRGETAEAVRVAAAQFIEANALGGTRPL